MATINNLKGTTYPSFLVGKRGTTIYQGTGLPASSVASPVNGDIYIQRGSSTTDQGIWQYTNSSWVQMQTSNSNLSDLSSITRSNNILLGSSGSNTIVGLTPAQVSTVLGLGSASTHPSTDFATASQGQLANSAVQPSSLATVATSGLYSDLKSTPDLTGGTLDISVKSLKTDGGNISTDGAGNLKISGSVTPGTLITPSSKYANLTTTPVLGQTVLVTDGRKPGEGSGAGTGVFCIYDGSNWMDVSGGTTVQV